jgi:hypothetical protein
VRSYTLAKQRQNKMNRVRRSRAALLNSGVSFSSIRDDSIQQFKEQGLTLSSRVNMAVETLSRNSLKSRQREEMLLEIISQNTQHVMTVNRVLSIMIKTFLPDYANLAPEEPEGFGMYVDTNDLIVEQARQMHLLKTVLVGLNGQRDEQDQVLWYLESLNRETEEEEDENDESSKAVLQKATEELTTMIISLNGVKEKVAVLGPGALESDNPLFQPPLPASGIASTTTETID